MSNGNGSKSLKPRVIFEKFKYRQMTYSLEGIPCRHPDCTKCPHGRYWYLRLDVKRKKETFYLGGRLQIVSWEVEGLGGLTIEELYRRRKERQRILKEKALQKALDEEKRKQK